jgi:glycosyltransferase involved in cell wall biosynthesis
VSKKKPKVSVCVVTYNQEKYIRQCLQSIVEQETDFDFEVIVGDDCSTDGTRSVIRAFVVKYPDIVNPIFRDTNIGAMNNFADILSVANGNYIALCEGDDYWTDPLKLQKQVDFLEAHPEYGLVHTDYQVYIQKERRFKSSPKHKIHNGGVFEKLIYHNFVATLSVCFKKKLLAKIDNNFQLQKFKVSDLPLWLELSRFTKFYYIPDITGVYRLLEKSAMHGSMKEELAIIKCAINIRKYFIKKYSMNKVFLFFALYRQYERIPAIIVKFLFKKLRKFKNLNN